MRRKLRLEADLDSSPDLIKVHFAGLVFGLEQKALGLGHGLGIETAGLGLGFGLEGRFVTKSTSNFHCAHLQCFV